MTADYVGHCHVEDSGLPQIPRTLPSPPSLLTSLSTLLTSIAKGG